MQYTETQLTKLIEDVEKEFTAHLAKAEEDTKVSSVAPESIEVAPAAPAVEAAAPLEKAEDEKKPEKKEEHKPEAEAKPEAKEDAKPAEAEAKKPEAEAKPADEGQKPEAEAKPEAHSEASHDYDSEDLAHLEKMYMSMSEPELKVHHDMIAKCGDMKMEKPAMAKSEEIKPIEIKTETVVPNQEVELLKSELSAEKGKFEELKKQYDGVAEFLSKLLAKKAAPAPKAITSLDVIAKSEGAGAEDKTLTKSEIDAVLMKKASDPSLKKSDRDAINAYYLNGESINSINHLLK